MVSFWGEACGKRKRARASPHDRHGLRNASVSNADHLGAAFKGTDPETERGPPPQATLVSFPGIPPFSAVDWTTSHEAPDLRAVFAKVTRPTDLSKDHLQVLNVDNRAPCRIEELISTGNVPTLPSANEENTVLSYADAAKVESNVAGKRKAFSERLQELQYDNDAAFRAITKTTKSGNNAPRLAYMRKFWEGLETMSQYWDVSLDEYYEDTSIDQDEGHSLTKGAKRARLSSMNTQPENVLRSFRAEVKDESPSSEHTESDVSSEAIPKIDSPQDGVEIVNSQGEPFQDSHQDRDISVSPPPQRTPRMRYKGRRTSTGRDMPDAFRSDTVRAFVEGIVWPFQASVAPPRRLPVIQINKLNLPVRQTAVVSRVPSDRIKARSGIIEGPILGIQVRAETEFPAQHADSLDIKTAIDQLREIGGLLELAQERRREGRPDVKPGENQWWTTKPRWGGGPGGEVGEAESEGNTGMIAAVEEALGAAKAEVPPRRPRRKTPAMLWRELKCGSGIRDQKTEYLAIGKNPKSLYDEIFMLSSLNHHVSILKLTVHAAYLDYLADARFPDPPPKEIDWSRPKLQRSEWFDLFDVEQRVEAFKALWGIMEYLTRDIDFPNSEDSKSGVEVKTVEVQMPEA